MYQSADPVGKLEEIVRSQEEVLSSCEGAKIGVHETSVRLAKLSNLVNKAEEIYEENDVVCTTDLEELFPRSRLRESDQEKAHIPTLCSIVRSS